MGRAPQTSASSVECEACSSSESLPDKRVQQPGKKALVNRLRRIEGQIGGVLSMVEDDRYCVDILMQISAVKSALDGVAIQILSAHANGCVRKAVKEDDGAEAIEELLGVIRKMIR
ncbi:metal-sensitive transcriptional regulator [Acetobacter senegalensis]|uniref:metal-sensitive transcriptional regulator n=1 Tax=Acetobacter senegalensis TaxID=446692 RepID=UPI000AFE51F7|nr:metal-sensitive transcriptional regulator [Acetobacter senegalensis]